MYGEFFLFRKIIFQKSRRWQNVFSSAVRLSLQATIGERLSDAERNPQHNVRDGGERSFEIFLIRQPFF